MAVFILTWSPSRWSIGDEEYANAIAEVAAQGQHVESWSTGNRKQGIQPGDTAVLLRQHRDRGLVAGGTFTSAIYRGKHWDDRRRRANYADLIWTAWVPLADRLPVETLKGKVPTIAWDRLQGSGVLVPAHAEQPLLDLWSHHLNGLGTPAEEVPPGEYEEGSVQKVLVNHYERSPQARQACIDHYGPSCTVCGFDFASTYGAVGQGYIHVHHLKEVSTLPPGYKVNPIKDLRPVCANCHSMLHRTRPALPIAKLKKAMGNA